MRGEDGRETDSDVGPVAKKGLHVLRGAVIRNSDEQTCMPSPHCNMSTGKDTVKGRNMRLDEDGEASNQASNATADEKAPWQRWGHWKWMTTQWPQLQSIRTRVRMKPPAHHGAVHFFLRRATRGR